MEVIKALSPKGIILSGGPYSVYQEQAPHAPKGIWDLNLPILGICYGLQEDRFYAWRQSHRRRTPGIWPCYR